MILTSEIHFSGYFWWINNGFLHTANILPADALVGVKFPQYAPYVQSCVAQLVFSLEM